MIKNSNKEENKTFYAIEVLRAKEVNDSITFDMKVNGITIYGCWYRSGQKKDGTEYTLVSFPSQKGKDGNYYNHAWFPITKEMISDIEKMIEEVL